MTRDQKPGKVRVIGQRDAGRPAHPMRRATDIDPNAPQGSEDDRGTGVAGGAGAVGAANGAGSESTSKGGGMALLPILFFLLACAGGGVAFTLFALPALAR